MKIKGKPTSLMTKVKNKKIIWLLLFVFLIIVLSFLYKLWLPWEKVVEIIQSNKLLSPLLFTFFAGIQVVLFPVPGYLIGILGGYLFGWIEGTVYSIIGVTLGSFAVFYLSRKLGRPFVDKLDKKGKIRKLEELARDEEEGILFLVLLLPFMPDDLISLVAGITRINTFHFVIITILGRLPGFLFLNLVGAGLAKSRDKFTIIIFMALIVLLSVVLSFYRHSLEKYSVRLIKRYKRQVK